MEAHQTRAYDDTRILVQCLPFSMTEDQMESLFSSVGAVKSCKIIKSLITGRNLGFGYVNYFVANDAKLAVATFNGFMIENRALVVSYNMFPFNEDEIYPTLHSSLNGMPFPLKPKEGLFTQPPLAFHTLPPSIVSLCNSITGNSNANYLPNTSKYLESQQDFMNTIYAITTANSAVDAGIAEESQELDGTDEPFTEIENILRKVQNKIAADKIKNAIPRSSMDANESGKSERIDNTDDFSIDSASMQSSCSRLKKTKSSIAMNVIKSAIDAYDKEKSEGINNIDGPSVDIDSMQKTARSEMEASKTAISAMDAIKTARSAMDAVETARNAMDANKTAKSAIDAIKTARSAMDAIKTARSAMGVYNTEESERIKNIDDPSISNASIQSNRGLFKNVKIAGNASNVLDVGEMEEPVGLDNTDEQRVPYKVYPIDYDSLQSNLARIKQSNYARLRSSNLLSAFGNGRKAVDGRKTERPEEAVNKSPSDDLAAINAKYNYDDKLKKWKALLSARRAKNAAKSLESGRLGNTDGHQIPHRPSVDVASRQTNSTFPENRKRPIVDPNELGKESNLKQKRPKNESPRSSFFSSFEEYLTDMTKNEKLELHMKVLQAIMDIKSRHKDDVVTENNKPGDS